MINNNIDLNGNLNMDDNNSLLQQLLLQQQQQQQQQQGGSSSNTYLPSFKSTDGAHSNSFSSLNTNDLGPNPIETMILNQQKQNQQQNQQQPSQSQQTNNILLQQMMFGSQNMNMNTVSSGSSLASMMMRNNNASSQQQLQQQQMMMRRMSNQGWGGTNFGGNNNGGNLDELSPIGLGRQLTNSFGGGGGVGGGFQPNNVASSLFASSLGNSHNQNRNLSAATLNNFNSSNRHNPGQFSSDLLTLMASNGMVRTNNASSSSLAATPGGINNPLLQQVGLVPPTSTSAFDQTLSQPDMNEDNNVAPNATASSSTGNDVYAENGLLGPWSAHAAGLLGNMIQDSVTKSVEDDKKSNRKKPKDRPKRPLSAYNIFFKEERNRILESLPVNAAINEQEGAESSASDKESSHGSLDEMKPKKRKRKRKGPAPHGKIGFESLAKLIGKRWQELDAAKMDEYKQKAQDDMQRYKTEMAAYKEKKIVQQNHQQQQQQNGDISDSMFETGFLEPKPIIETGMFQQQEFFSNGMNMNDSSPMDLQQQLQLLQQQLQQQQQQHQSSANQGLWGLMTSSESKQMDDSMANLGESSQPQQSWKKCRLDPSVFQVGNGSNSNSTSNSGGN